MSLKRRSTSQGPNVNKFHRHTQTRGIPDVSWENRLSAVAGKPLDNATKNLLQRCTGTVMPAQVSVPEIMKKSNSFPLEFPIDTVRISELRKRIPEATLESHANSVYPLIHEDMLPLIADWLKHKKEQGTPVEKTLYENMGLIDLVQRLIERRAFCFIDGEDVYKILEVPQGFGGWEWVGTKDEQPPLVLRNYISYDEIKLSAMLTMSSHTEFINDGSRMNEGVPATDPETIEPRGVIIGVVGSRFEKPGFMEYQDIAISPAQNTMENGYGPESQRLPNAGETATRLRGLRQVWARFYGESHLPLYDEVTERLRSIPEDPKYVSVQNRYIFKADNYVKRTLITAEIVLMEANARAMEKNTTAYLHVVGFGLGVWKALPEQAMYFMKSFEIALKRMMPKIQHVFDVMFAYLGDETNCGGVEDGELFGHVKLHFGKREPHAVLDDDKLLVVTYAWDGNALPGNEFWMGSLSGSGDPAAACSTQVAELHNVRINPRASAASLHIASPEHGVLHISDYAKLRK